jgi:hypothetical protein
MIDVYATAGTFPTLTSGPPTSRPQSRRSIGIVPAFAEEALSHADD